MIVQLVGKT